MNDVSVEEWFAWAWEQSPPPGAVAALQRMGVVKKPWDRKWSFLGVSSEPAYLIEFWCKCVMRPEQLWPKGKPVPAMAAKQRPVRLVHNTVMLGNEMGEIRVSLAECDHCRVIYWAEVPRG